MRPTRLLLALVALLIGAATTPAPAQELTLRQNGGDPLVSDTGCYEVEMGDVIRVEVTGGFGVVGATLLTTPDQWATVSQAPLSGQPLSYDLTMTSVTGLELAVLVHTSSGPVLLPGDTEVYCLQAELQAELVANGTRVAPDAPYHLRFGATEATLQVTLKAGDNLQRAVLIETRPGEALREIEVFGASDLLTPGADTFTKTLVVEIDQRPLRYDYQLVIERVYPEEGRVALEHYPQAGVWTLWPAVGIEGPGSEGSGSGPFVGIEGPGSDGSVPDDIQPELGTFPSIEGSGSDGSVPDDIDPGTGIVDALDR